MNFKLPAFLLLTACACSRAPQGGERELERGLERELLAHWPARSGQEPVLRMRGQEAVVDGEWVKSGEFLFYDERGNLRASGSYQEGLEHGPWAQFEPDGDVGRGQFRSGRREGQWTYSYPNGQLQEEGGYVGSVRKGFWTRWHENGQVRAEVMYQDGKLHGTCRYWLSDGREDVHLSGRYEAGERVN